MKQILILSFLVLPVVLPAQNGWRYIGPEEREISLMAVKGDLIFASVVIPPVGGGYSTRRIYRSTDAGISWEMLDTNRIPGSSLITILDGNPPNIFGAQNYRLFFSSDLGRTWDSTQQPALMERVSVYWSFAKPNATGILFALGKSFPDVDRLFRSTDYGRTWKEPFFFPQLAMAQS